MNGFDDTEEIVFDETKDIEEDKYLFSSLKN